MIICGIVIWALYSCLILTYTRYWFRTPVYHPKTDAKKSKYFVSIVVAARNEENQILFLLEDLRHQSLPPEAYEVIIVDDHSSDKTSSQIAEFIDLHLLTNFRIETVDAHSFGKKSALSVGVEKASGQIILTTDADCRIPFRWVEIMSNVFRNEMIHICSGLVTYQTDKSWFSRLQALEFLSLVASGFASIQMQYPVMCNGANMAYRKKSFVAVGGYDSDQSISSGDDIFLFLKIRKHFGKESIAVCKHKEAVCSTSPTSSLKAFFTQRFRWAGKTPAVSDPLIKGVALIVLATNIWLIVGWIGCFFIPSWWLWMTGMWLSIAIINFPLLFGITSFLNQRYLLRTYPLLQIIYPWYIIFAGILGMLLRPQWKSRRISS